MSRQLGFFTLLTLLLALLTSFGATGCDCDSGPPVFTECNANQLLCVVEDRCVPVDETAICDTPLICETNSVYVDGMCAPACACVQRPPLGQGVMATYLDVAAYNDIASEDYGKVVIAGYSPGFQQDPANLITDPYTNGRAYQFYGDLVFGEYDEEDSEIKWEIVDGAPVGDQGKLVASDAGWRGGYIDNKDNPSDDVGKFTSIVTAGDRVMISYYDETHGDLKFATRDGAGDWAVHVVAGENDNSGEYTSMTLMKDNVPAIAYLAIVPPDLTNAQGDIGGRPTSRARVIIANAAVPASATDWGAPLDVYEAKVQCRPEYCGADQICILAAGQAGHGECITEDTIDTADCFDTEDTTKQICTGDSEICINEVCYANEASLSTLPDVVGMHNQLVAIEDANGELNDLAYTFYDRLGGNLWGSRYFGANGFFDDTEDDDADASTPTYEDGKAFLIDGYGTGTGTGAYDAGLANALTVGDDGIWHAVYLNGTNEQLLHRELLFVSLTMSFEIAPTAEVIDDGTLGGTQFPKSIVGDDAEVVITADNEMRVVYQDATRLKAYQAVRQNPPTDPNNPWVVSVLDEANATGYWTSQALVGDVSYVGVHWVENSDFTNGTRVFTIGEDPPANP